MICDSKAKKKSEPSGEPKNLSNAYLALGAKVANRRNLKTHRTLYLFTLIPRQRDHNRVKIICQAKVLFSDSVSRILVRIIIDESICSRKMTVLAARQVPPTPVVSSVGKAALHLLRPGDTMQAAKRDSPPPARILRNVNHVLYYRNYKPSSRTYAYVQLCRELFILLDS